MPECAIGLFPDVGASYFLNQLVEPGLALYLALTGARLDAWDCIKCNLATHYISSLDLVELKGILQESIIPQEPSSVGAFLSTVLAQKTTSPYQTDKSLLTDETLYQIKQFFDKVRSVLWYPTYLVTH